MRVRFSIRARLDMVEIGDWIARDNPARAHSFVLELEDAALALSDFPAACPLAPEFGVGVRKQTHGKYLILYRVAREITIASIRHAARDRRLT